MCQVIEEELTNNDEITSTGIRSLLLSRWSDLRVSVATIKLTRREMGWVCTRPHYCHGFSRIKLHGAETATFSPVNLSTFTVLAIGIPRSHNPLRYSAYGLLRGQTLYRARRYCNRYGHTLKMVWPRECGITCCTVCQCLKQL